MMISHRKILSLLATTAMVTSLATLAVAAPVMWVDDSANNLFRVDVDTGAITPVGAMSTVGTVFDIAFAPGGDLYATTSARLYRVNPTTAATTLVGLLGVTAGMNALVFASDGTLYGASGTTSQLYSINTATGAATALGNIGAQSGGDLAFNGGNLYLATTANQLRRIDLSNLAASANVGPFGVSDVFGIATGDDGVLYGVAGRNIYSVNVGTGAATFESSWSSSFGTGFGQSFISEAAPPPPPPPPGPPPPPPPTGEVPAPATGVLLLTGLAAAYVLRRRRD